MAEELYAAAVTAICLLMHLGTKKLQGMQAWTSEISLAHSTPADLWLVAGVVAAHVDGNDVVVLCECCHLVPPAIPALGKAVEEQHQGFARLAAGRY